MCSDDDRVAVNVQCTQVLDLNHGSFGATPRYVTDAQLGYMTQRELVPDVWFRTTFREVVRHVRSLLSDYIGANDDDVVLIENASSGVNAILQSLVFDEGDVILYFSTKYGMVKTASEHWASRFGLTIEEIPVNFPAAVGGGSEMPDFVAKANETLEEYASRGVNVRLAIFSHIASTPAVILPIAELAATCENHGIDVLVDGAHALGQIPLNMGALEEAGVDFYLANGHKWLFSPTGSAFLWVNPSFPGRIIPTVLSFGDDFQSDFEYTGTRDYTAFAAMKDALDFRAHLGDERVIQYSHDTCAWAQDYLATAWGTEPLTSSEYIGSMANVRLPGEASGLTEKLLSEYGLYVVAHRLEVFGDGVQARPIEEQWWARVSCAVYTGRDDIERLGAAVKEVYAL